MLKEYDGVKVNQYEAPRNKELLDKLKGILDWWSLDEYTDSEEIEKELTSLLDDAYFRGWSDAKDDSDEEANLQDDGN